MSFLFPSEEQSCALMWAIRGLWAGESATFGESEGVEALGGEANFLARRVADIREVSEAIPVGKNRFRVTIIFANKVEKSRYTAEVILSREGDGWAYQSMIVSKIYGLGPTPWDVQINSEFVADVLEIAPHTRRAA